MHSIPVFILSAISGFHKTVLILFLDNLFPSVHSRMAETSGRYPLEDAGVQFARLQRATSVIFFLCCARDADRNDAKDLACQTCVPCTTAFSDKGAKMRRFPLEGQAERPSYFVDFGTRRFATCPPPFVDPSSISLASTS